MKKYLMIVVSLGTWMGLNACVQTPNTPTPSAPTHTAAQEAARALTLQAVDWYNAKNYAQATPLFEQAMAAGDMKAPRYIGLMYLNGEGRAKNVNQAFAAFSEGAKRGDITSQYWLGYLYENGIGVARDLAQARAWYTTSAQRGDHVAAPAMVAL